MTNIDLFSQAEPEQTAPAKPIVQPAAMAPLFQAPDPTLVIRKPKVSDEDEEYRRPRSKGNRRKNVDEVEANLELEDEQSSRRNRTRKNRSDERVEADDESKSSKRRTRRKAVSSESDDDREQERSVEAVDEDEELGSGSRRRRRRRTRVADNDAEVETADERDPKDEVTALKGSTRLEAKRQRRKEGRKEGRKKTVVTEAEFLARRESVERLMLVRERDGLNQIAVIEDGLLVEHYVARRAQTSKVGNVYVGKIQNVLPSMEAAFVDIGEGRNGVLYAGEVNWDISDMAGKQRRIEKALSSGDSVLVQVTKDPIGHKGARLTSQITLAGRYLVLVPSGSMTGISRKLPEKERVRLKKILRQIVPKGFGVIVRTAAEGATAEQLTADVKRLEKQWLEIEKKQKKKKGAPYIVRSEPELAVRVVRDIFNEDFTKLIVSGENAWETISEYVKELSPELAPRLEKYEGEEDIFASYRVDQQLAKGMDRKAWLPSGGSLVIDRTEAMTVIDVNTGRYTGSGGTLEETVTKNNLEAAEEIVRQLRLRDIGGIIVIDFVDMVLESNRDLVLRRLVECLGRDRTRHQVSEVTALGLVQMTRKRVGQGLVEAFSTECECCGGRGFIVHDKPIERERDDILDAFEKPSKRNKKESANAAKAKARAEAAAKAEHAKVTAAMTAIAQASLKSEEAAEEALQDAIAVVEEAAEEIIDTQNTKKSGVKKSRDAKQKTSKSDSKAKSGKKKSAAKGAETDGSDSQVAAPNKQAANEPSNEVTVPKARKRRVATSGGVVTTASTSGQNAVSGSEITQPEAASETSGASATPEAERALGELETAETRQTKAASTRSHQVRAVAPRRARRRVATTEGVVSPDVNPSGEVQSNESEQPEA
ncbi:hypothetical protein BK816_05025 [Boudabousia tangfeifanii]|uniref:Ribonuclease E n=1 Tax=Boudabousia tangfeifanii TaxID=1912795 RepID=A0A1D9MK97_9ACTO|nr:Rne/Rng family ribonuclease [Boudabousia tangfeifanii]AOZ72734.1 hypothetical protein BK816_05025 [Boudabousia tangfeifanii]